MYFKLDKSIRCILTLFFLSGLVACNSVKTYQIKSDYQQQELFHNKPMGEKPQLLAIDQLFELTETQKKEIKQLFGSSDYRKLSPSRKIYKFLRTQLQYFNFHSDTLVASDALELNSGNCLSLAILTKALAQMSNVAIQYELAKTPGVFQRESGFLLNSQHIRTVIYDKHVTNVPMFSSKDLKIKIDYFSTLGSRTLRKVKKEEFYAMFYSNRAAESMIDGQLETAYWHLKEAIQLDKDNLVAINMLGVLYDRMGHVDFAERLFEYGLSFGHDQLEMLNNYHKLLVRNNRVNKAQEIAVIIDEYNDPNPFKWLDLADQELKNKNYLRAIKFYEKAIQKADYLHQPYAGLAKANFFLGRTNQAIKAITKAIENSHNGQVVSVYQSKYDHMKSSHSNHN
ncbi:tetratricopeptide repeat protein [Marinicella rhabdoformis]|uniref:tetratricopeptide repeat protein n=1 Tax=Marinicella rhabdoformis TaxID=2580566 RepID=UPI0012AEBAFB|nr:hypothetical protein [Marinicella rhabdoformis]